MKRKVVLGLIVSALTMSLFTACGTTTTNLSESTEETVSIAETQYHESTEAPHEHTYTEAIPATGHSFTN